MIQKITIYGSASSSHDVNRSHLVSGLRFGLYCGSIILNSHLILLQKKKRADTRQPSHIIHPFGQPSRSPPVEGLLPEPPPWLSPPVWVLSEPFLAT